VPIHVLVQLSACTRTFVHTSSRREETCEGRGANSAPCGALTVASDASPMKGVILRLRPRARGPGARPRTLRPSWCGVEFSTRSFKLVSIPVVPPFARLLPPAPRTPRYPPSVCLPPRPSPDAERRIPLGLACSLPIPPPQPPDQGQDDTSVHQICCSPRSPPSPPAGASSSRGRARPSRRRTASSWATRSGSRPRATASSSTPTTTVRLRDRPRYS
jgi:hypothetical protein